MFRSFRYLSRHRGSKDHYGPTIFLICTISFGNYQFPLLSPFEFAGSLKAGTLSYFPLCPMPPNSTWHIAGTQQMSALS